MNCEKGVYRERFHQAKISDVKGESLGCWLLANMLNVADGGGVTSQDGSLIWSCITCSTIFEAWQKQLWASGSLSHPTEFKKSTEDSQCLWQSPFCHKKHYLYLWKWRVYCSIEHRMFNMSDCWDIEQTNTKSRSNHRKHVCYLQKLGMYNDLRPLNLKFQTLNMELQGLVISLLRFCIALMQYFLVSCLFFFWELKHIFSPTLC